MSEVQATRLESIIARLSPTSHDEILNCPLSHIQDQDERLWQLRLFCTPLLEGVHHATAHFEQLDRQLSTLLSLPAADFKTQQGPDGSLEAAIANDLPTQVDSLLSRLPALPQRSFSLPFNNGLIRKQGTTMWDGIKSGRWATKYAVPEAREKLQLETSDDPAAILKLIENLQDTAWENLYVTRLIDTNTLTLAVIFEREGTRPNLDLARKSFQYINVLSELLDQYQAICDAISFGILEPFKDPSDEVQALKGALFPEDDEEYGHVQARAIIKVFLWSAWQRSAMLHFYYVIGVQLSSGYSSTWNSLLAIRGIGQLMTLSQDDYRGTSCTEYLCNWAFEVLKTSRTSVGLDFRGMISRFDKQFHDRPGRCIKGSSHACKSGQPESCQRFTEAETAAQSVHMAPCDGHCEKVIWDASSYYHCLKPAAVVVEEESQHLTYAPVGSRTLAISHVWSHGQGGRPESGINSCLHKRYCRLARHFGCSTYWIDSAAIPSEQTLRRQAIDNINVIFATAMVTLVIDADIQAITTSLPSPTVPQIETIISTLLVSDWSVRGWTMLEAIRGSRSIHLLCNDDHPISLLDALRFLHKEGAIDIAALLGGAQHLIPHSDPKSSKTVEEAGYILSQRHTSWPEDVIICWSLLMNVAVRKTAAGLWKTQSRVRTGYLLSTADRVEQRGLTWAPNTPYIRPEKRSVRLPNGQEQVYTRRFPPYDGDGSLFAEITPTGLHGRWRVIDVDRTLLDNAKDIFNEMVPRNNDLRGGHEIEFDDFEPENLVYAHPDEVRAWSTMDMLLGQGAQVRLVRALAEDGLSAYTGTSQRGEDFGLVAAICASFDHGATWDWKGVYSWQESDNYEGWEVCEMLIV